MSSGEGTPAPSEDAMAVEEPEKEDEHGAAMAVEEPATKQELPKLSKRQRKKLRKRQLEQQLKQQGPAQQLCTRSVAAYTCERIAKLDDDIQPKEC